MASECELSSSARELIAVEVALRRLAAKIKEAGVYNIYWVTDSWVLTVWLQKGTRQRLRHHPFLQYFFIPIPTAKAVIS